MTPVIDRTGWAGWQASHAMIAFVSVNHIVAIVVCDRADRTSRLAGIAADANNRVNQMLLDEAACDDFHGDSTIDASGVRPMMLQVPSKTGFEQHKRLAPSGSWRSKSHQLKRM